MGVVVSATAFTLRDQGGTPRTQGYFTLEYRATGYVPGGEVFDLSAYFRRVETVLALTPISGALQGFLSRTNLTDFPGDARSGRLQLEGLASGVSVSFASGLFLVTSGNASGFQLLSGGGLFNSTPISGFATIGTGQALRTELLSGVAVSGARTQAWIIGY